ncbi:nitroreductase [Pollutimonas harenae]|uniref:Nitroreductase n=1 Tax=Pollutimonas harenae TaxID=657015 RepID=A0A853H9B4_9BURK|nr:nitroreductase [Pollutimonas harenae]NYT87013.1 nitroreductase [Pollutimonas harenae]TEA69233.1 nitroreductase [Pollutimonas harenae]
MSARFEDLPDQTFQAVKHAIVSRKSTRAFLPRPVEPALIDELLLIAGMAPSGSNIQPWKVHVVSGKARDKLSAELLAAHQQKMPEEREYQYYPVKWRSPYIERRRATGWGLYGLLNITKGDREATARQHGRNFEFFDAPVVLIFTMDNDMETGSWLDYGMFLQNLMVAARGCGLHTCPQAALANYPGIVKKQLTIGDDQIIVCGMVMGYEDTSDPVNQFQPSRIGLEEFVTYHRD